MVITKEQRYDLYIFCKKPIFNMIKLLKYSVMEEEDI